MKINFTMDGRSFGRNLPEDADYRNLSDEYPFGNVHETSIFTGHEVECHLVYNLTPGYTFTSEPSARKAEAGGRLSES